MGIISFLLLIKITITWALLRRHDPFYRHASYYKNAWINMLNEGPKKILRLHPKDGRLNLRSVEKRQMEEMRRGEELPISWMAVDWVLANWLYFRLFWFCFLIIWFNITFRNSIGTRFITLLFSLIPWRVNNISWVGDNATLENGHWERMKKS